MTVLSIDTTFPAADWNSGDIRTWLKTHVERQLDTVAEVQNSDLETTRFIYVKANGASYRYDASNTDADDGVNVIHDNQSRRYVRISRSNGNVGIGTDAQTGAGTLDVAGALRIQRETNAFGMSSAWPALILGQGQSGGLYAIGRSNSANEPFTGMSGFDSGATKLIYYGGGGWACPDAQRHQFYCDASYSETNNAGALRFSILSSAVVVETVFRPGTDNAHTCGDASYRFSAIWAVTGTIQTSDERLKDIIGPVALGLDFVRELDPIAYRWKVGGNVMESKRVPNPDDPDNRENDLTIEEPKPVAGKRIHYGLSAQKVKALLDKHKVEDFGGWVLTDKDDPDSEQGLRYEQFVPILIKATQELAATVDMLTREIAELKTATGNGPRPRRG